MNQMINDSEKIKIEKQNKKIPEGKRWKCDRVGDYKVESGFEG